MVYLQVCACVGHKEQEILIIHVAKLVSLVGKVPVYRVGGLGFDSRPDQHSGS